MDQATRQKVRERAGFSCEYCQLSEVESAFAKLQIEHIVPKKHGGTDELENLALGCIRCNLHKGTNLTGIDPSSGQVVELYNPRTHLWAEHFRWDGCFLTGITAVGRTTIRVLEMNTVERIRVRAALRN
jgi:hypothetical protein